ncbi:MAG: hypothetical protein ACOX0C_01425 [Patescibacteria group bacterium]|jgi:hypothetical protein
MTWQYLKFILVAPGIVVHELAHVFFCLLFRVRIHRISLLRYDKVAGFVIHDEPRRFFPALFISLGPLIINSLLAIWLFSLISQPYSALSILFLWLGIVLGLQAIPSTGDARALFNNAKHNILRNPLVILFFPVVLVIYLLNILKQVYIHFIYVIFLLALSPYFNQALEWLETLIKAN